jgi:putative ABC transport system permease protein
MNLAFKDIRFNLGRFVMTAAGVGFLVTASIGMVGLYRGIVADALLIIDGIGADLWVVQGERSGPFAESSAIAATMDRRVEGLPGVADVRRFFQMSQQFRFQGQDLRAALTGVDFPRDDGSWITLEGGRRLASGHFEAIADVSTGLSIDDVVRFGQDDYRIVGTTRGMVDATGDGLVFVTINDILTIAAQRTSEEVLLARADPTRRASAAARIAAVLVRLHPGVDASALDAAIAAWGDANVVSHAEQRSLLLDQRLWRLRVQILAFTAVLLVVMAIVISLIIYTLTIEKLHQIAMLKLIGARNAVIVAMIAEQAALIGAGGFAFGLMLSNLIFPYFPRRVVIDRGDLAMLALAIAVICAFASLLGISRALNVRAQEVLS